MSSAWSGASGSQLDTATSISLSSKNDLLACSTARGLVHLYPMNDLIGQGGRATPTSTYVQEVSTLKNGNSSSSINQVAFSPLSEDTLAIAQDDGQVTLFDVKGQKPTFAFH